MGGIIATVTYLFFNKKRTNVSFKLALKSVEP